MMIGRRKSSSASSKGDEDDTLTLTVDKSDELFDGEIEEETYGPVLPPKQNISDKPPACRSESLDADSKSNEDSESEKGEYFGPALPPTLKTRGDDGSKKCIGPALPPGFKLPDSSESDSEGEAVGPQLVPDIYSPAQQQLEMRARRLRHDMTSGNDDGKADQKRESWMLELPPEKAVNLGMGPRQFRKREALDPGDRSVWTDTPSDRLKKTLDPKPSLPDSSQLNTKAIQERDEAMEKLAERQGSKREAESLLEMHQKKLKKKKEKDSKEGKSEERRPFSRELDLQTNRFDEAQKKSIFNKARLLNDRFSAGQSKYL